MLVLWWGVWLETREDIRKQQQIESVKCKEVQESRICIKYACFLLLVCSYSPSVYEHYANYTYRLTPSVHEHYVNYCWAAVSPLQFMSIMLTTLLKPVFSFLIVTV